MLNVNSKKILRYVLPSVCAMVVSCTYTVVDGMFVGQGVGENALAAVNLSVPFVEIMTALASMLTVGGATVMSIRKGRGENEKANQAFMTSVFLLGAVALVLTLIGTLFPSQLARAFGATDLLVEGTATYIRWYMLFSIFFTISLLGAVFVRNDGSPGLAFWGMICGAVTNIFLDWLFIFPLGMGIKGAAIASGLGQIVSCAILSIHFIRRAGILRIRRIKMDSSLCKKVVVRGLPEFVVQLSQPVTIFCYNQVILRLLGESGLAAFSTASYLLIIMMGVYLGVSQGMQPLVGQSFGEQNQTDLSYFFRAGLKINVMCSIVVYLIYFFGGDLAASLFISSPSSSSALIQTAHHALRIYGLSFILASICTTYTTYFLSTKRTTQALVISIARGLVLNSIFIFAVPYIFDADWIWYPVIISEMLTVGIAVCLKKRHDAIDLKKMETT